MTRTRVVETPPKPLRTSLALLAVGALAIGGVALALPRLSPRPSRTAEVPHDDAVTLAAPFQNGPGAMGAMGGGATPSSSGGGPTEQAGGGAQGGGPPAIDEEARNDAGVVRAPLAIASADAGRGGQPAIAGAPIPVPVATGETIGGASAGDAGAGSEVGTNAGALSTDGDAAANPYSQLAFPIPWYGAPPASTSTSGPVTNGAAGSTTPLWGLAGGGAGGTGGSTTSDGNSGVVNPRPSIAATLLVPMSQGEAPESAWTSISTYLRSGDVVVARTPGDSSADAVALLGFSDRVRTDTPLVSYVLAVTDVTKLKSMVAKGLPATLDAIGPAQTDALDATNASALSSQVHGAGKRFFLSVSSSASKIPLAQVGASAEIVELVIAASAATPAATEVSQALGALRSTGNPLVFVRLPPGAIASTTAVTSFTATVQQSAPNVGFALPPGTSSSTLADLRASQ